MTIDKRFARHDRLVRRMAEAHGVDLDLAELCGAVTPGERRDAVLACTGCAHPEDCERRLVAGEVTAAPRYCRNAALIREIAGVIEA